MLPVSKGGLPSFLYPISYRTDRFCIHFKTPGLPHKRGQMRSKLTNIPIQIVLWIFQGKPQQGQNQSDGEAPSGVTDSLHKAAALSTAQVGKDTRQHAGVGVGSHWLGGQGLGVGGKKPINLHRIPISTGRRLFIQQSLLQL